MMYPTRFRRIRPGSIRRHATFSLFAATALLLGLAAALPSQAQTVTFPGVINTVAGNGSPSCTVTTTTGCYGGDGGLATGAELNGPYSVALDRSGNLYIADSLNLVIRKVSAATGVITTVAGNGSSGDSGDGGPATSAEFLSTQAVAVDGSGNIYIADAFDFRIRVVNTQSTAITIAGISIPAGAIQTVAGTGTGGYSSDGGQATSSQIGNSFGVVVDRSGNIYFSDDVELTTISAARVRKVDGATGVITTVAGTGLIGDSGDGGPAIDAKLDFPTGLALDGSGNLYIVDVYNNNVRVVNTQSTAITFGGVSIPAGDIQTLAGSGGLNGSGYSGDGGPATSAELNNPNDVAVDGLGNLYIADTVNNVVRKVNAATGFISTVAGNKSLNCVYGGDPGCYGGDGGPATSAGLQFLLGVAVDGSGNIYIADTGNSRIREVQYSAVNSGWIDVGQTSPVYSIYFSFMGTTQVGSYKIFTQGASGLDFQAAPGSTCTATTYTVGESCAVYVQFAPLAPGLRLGAVELLDTSGNLLATIYISGNGVGPAVAFSPSPQTTVPVTGVGNIYGLTVDVAGNVFISDGDNHRVVKVTPGGVQTTAATGLGLPYGLAVDGAGNLLIADSPANRVVTVTPSGVQSTVNASGLSSPQSVAVDGAGNVIIGSAATGNVVKVTPGGLQSAVGTGLNKPESIAVDGAGDVFIADIGNNQLVKVAPGGVQTTVPGICSVPNSVAVDAADDLFISCGGDGTVMEYSPSGAQTQVPPAGAPQAGHLAVDAAGDVFISSGSSVVEAQRSQPPSLAFNTTNTGSTSSDSPMTVTVDNIGNAPLAFTVPPTETNPSYPTDFPENNADSNLCSTGNAVAAGGTCDVSVNFSPTGSGSLSGYVVLSDSSLNATGATQSIAVSGTGVQTLTPQIINFVQPTTPVTWVSGLTIPLIAAGGVSGNAVVFTVDGSSTGTGSITGSTLTVTTPGTFVIDANQAGNATYSAAPQVQRTVVVNKASQAITFTQPTTPVTYTSGLEITLSATGGASGNAVVFTLDAASTATGTISGSMLTVTSAGNLVIDANQAGNADYSVAPQVQTTVVVTSLTAQSITFTQPASPVTFSTGLTIPLVATGGPSGNPVVFTLDAGSTGTGSITGSTLNVTSAGTFVIDANQAGNANYAAAPQVQRTVVVSSPTAQTITFTQPTTPVTFSTGLTIPLVASGGASGNPVVFTLDAGGSNAGSISGSTLAVTGVGTLIIDANQAGNATFSAATQVQRTVVVTQASQTINFTQPTTPVTFSTGLTIPLVATGGVSGNAVVFTIDASSTGVGSISGSTLAVTGVGTFVIDANQAGNATFSAATEVQRTVVVTQASQTIDFTQPTSPVAFSTGLTIPLVATGGVSGNAVVFTLDASSTGAGSISGSTLSVTGIGTFVIDANQAGNTNYSAAPQVQRSVVVGQVAQAITFAQPATPVTYAAGLTVSLSATGGASGNPVVFTRDAASTGAGTISGSTLTVTGVGTFVIDANQAGNANYSVAPQVQRTVVVAQASQTINFAQPTTPVTLSAGLTIPLIATGGASSSPVVFTLDASSTGAGSVSGSTLAVTGVGTFVIDANQAGDANYTAAPQVQRTIVVTALTTQVITFVQPTSPIAYASGLTVPLAATGGASGSPVVFTLDAGSSGVGSITGSTLTITSAGTFVVDANQAGNASFSAASQVQRSVVVTQASQTINFTQPTTPVTFSTGLTITLVATGGASGNPVVFTRDASSTAPGSISGSTLTVTGTGTIVIDANQAGNTNYTAAPQVQKTVVVNAPPPDFSVSVPSGAQTVAPGASGQYTVTVTDVGGAFTNAVALSVSGLPMGITGTFSPTSITPGSTSGTSTLTVQVPNGFEAMNRSGDSSSGLKLASISALGGLLSILLLLPLWRTRKPWRNLPLALFAIAALGTAGALTGCGGGFATTHTAQSYTLTITGSSSGDVSHSTTVQLTVP